MELKILKGKELERQLKIAGESVQWSNPDVLENQMSPELWAAGAAVKAQARLTLQQVVEWLEDRLGDYDVKQGGFSSDWFFIRITRSDWQQLKEVANGH